MPNRLTAEASPYLKQHADNPVDWYPWGEEALARARAEDKPILLSIGYSACHWCHVMAHESFEDADVAALMNALFVNIKVDREERPDLDHIYQTAHSMMIGRGGGWPLTMFLGADQVPFFGGTYFPKTPRYQMPTFPDLLQRVAQHYREQRGDVLRQREALLKALNHAQASAQPLTFSAQPIAAARQQLEDAFDSLHGGFGAAPKFPHPTDFSLLMRQYATQQDQQAWQMTRFSLEKMANGGLFDQLGGGFFRYSVDQAWQIPHFEKMLYDNALLIGVYSDAWLIEQQPRFAEVVQDSIGWLMTEMRSLEGGFYAALDADSEGEEGAYYVWRREAVQAIVGAADDARVAAQYGLDQPPNFDGHLWHLFLAQGSAEPTARAKLLAARQLRIRPGLDDKILTGWNALTIAALAKAGRAFDRQDWIDQACQNLDLLRQKLWQDGRLLAVYAGDKAYLDAYLDDYAYLLDAILTLLQARFRPADLQWAQQLAAVLLDEFEDKDNGGFYFTGTQHETLICRPKPGHDAATPSGNAIAAFALQRLGYLLAEPRYLQAAERTLQAFAPILQGHPASATSFLQVLAEYLQPPRIIILCGEAIAWQKALSERYAPAQMVLAIANDLAGLPANLDKPKGAWVCEGMHCLPAISDLQALLSHAPIMS